jgi:hypothetical protein
MKDVCQFTVYSKFTDNTLPNLLLMHLALPHGEGTTFSENIAYSDAITEDCDFKEMMIS